MEPTTIDAEYHLRRMPPEARAWLAALLEPPSGYDTAYDEAETVRAAIDRILAEVQP